MNPVAVLAQLETLGGTLPTTRVVGCRPGDVSEGIGLSAAVAAAVDDAMALVIEVVSDLTRARAVLTQARVGPCA